MENYKMYVIVRNDLKLGKGKLCAQTGHAFVNSYILYSKEKPEWIKKWLIQGQGKIVLKVPNLEELLTYYNKINILFPCVLIKDAGKTQIDPGTITCFGFGPLPETKVPNYIKKIKLL